MKKDLYDMKLDKEERAWEKWLRSGKARTIPNFEQHKKDLIASARAQRERTKLVSLRVREHDLARLRAKAEREGLPYQTLINSLIHKYAQEDYSK